MIRNIIQAISCTLAISLFSPANAATLLNPVGTNYTATDAGVWGVTDVEVHITSNGTFTLEFDNYGVLSEDIYITLVNDTGSDWSSFSINYDGVVGPDFMAILNVLGTGSGNPAVISTVFTDPSYFLATGFAADFLGGESTSVDIVGGLSDPYGLFTLMPITISTSAVPVPAAAWLFGSGLLGLVGVARRKKA